ncbi:hypothetical protein SCHPADRAFT_944846 [Schizopora paradoxa]|uniref:Uncharacterized protein n=1 Tax=Schizopora paradoxa TaxID=27342 RepID=A0A0H2REM2_9AGAM|nr:hypothetical protein SCHPADRAFT_944846 [Schizopora paradoxa]
MSSPTTTEHTRKCEEYTLTPEEFRRMYELIKKGDLEEREKEWRRSNAISAVPSRTALPAGQKSILKPSAKPRGLLFSFFVGVPCLFWEIIVVMVIFCVLFFIIAIQIILLAFSVFFFVYVFAAHFTGFSTVEFRSSRLEGL